MLSRLTQPVVSALFPANGTTSLKHRFLHGASWVTAGSVFARLMTFGTTVIVARMLGKEGFGEFGMVRSTMEVFLVLGAIRMGSTATKYVAQYRTADPAKAERVLAMSMTVCLFSCLLMVAIMGGLAPWLATHSLGRPTLAPALVIAAVYIFFANFAMVTELALSGFEAFRRVAMLQFLRGFLWPATAIWSTYRYGLKGLWAAIALNVCIELAVAYCFLQMESKRYQIRTRLSLGAIKQEWDIFVHFALPGVLSGLVTAVGIWTVNALFVNQPNGYASLGLFSAANQWKALILFLPDIISRVILPIMSSTLSDTDGSQFGKAASLNLRANVIIALPLAMTVILFRGQLMQFFGERFRGSEAVLPVLMLSVFACILTNTVNNTLTSAGKRWFTLAGTVSWALLLCGLVGGRVVPPTALGLGTAFAISYALYFAMVAVYAELILPGRVMRRHWSLVASAVVLLATAAFFPVFGTGWPVSGVSLALLVCSLLPSANVIACHLRRRVRSVGA